jgi:hypothetical protein
MLARHALGSENTLFDRIEFILEPVEQREVAVDHRVHQRIQNVTGSLAQQIRLALGSGTHVLKALFGVVAHG